MAVGAPWEALNGLNQAGAINLLYGSATGLSSTNAEEWSQGSSDIAETVESGDQFGHSLTIGYFNNDTYADLAVGVPLEDVDGAANAGTVREVVNVAIMR